MGGYDFYNAGPSVYEYSTEYIANLSDDHKYAIRDFSSNDRPNGDRIIFQDINCVLRSRDRNETFEEGNKERERLLHEALKEATLPQSVVVYRCVKSEDFNEIKDVSDEELLGRLIIDFGYMCTSFAADIDSLPPHFFQPSDTVLEIIAPKGTKAINIESISHFGSLEREITFDKNQMMKVDSIRREKGKRIISLVCL